MLESTRKGGLVSGPPPKCAMCPVGGSLPGPVGNGTVAGPLYCHPPPLALGEGVAMV